jgi:hypothetical protein
MFAPSKTDFGAKSPPWRSRLITYLFIDYLSLL